MSYSAFINELLEDAQQHNETIDPTTIGIYTLRNRLYVVLDTINCNMLTFLWSPSSQQWERTEDITTFVLNNCCREWVLSHDGELWYLDDDDNSRLLIETILDEVTDNNLNAHAGPSIDDDWNIDLSGMTDAELESPLTDDDDDDDDDIILTMPEGSEPTINLADILS